MNTQMFDIGMLTSPESRNESKLVRNLLIQHGICTQ